VSAAQKESIKGAAADAVPLGFPAMLCVLLVAITLRMVQLNLQPPIWACVAMLLSTVAVVVQAALAGVNNWRVAALQQPALQEIEGTVGRVAAAFQLTFMGCLCVGATLTVVSVFAMEPTPLAAIWPQSLASVSFLDLNGDRRPPLSTTMRCVMFLTVLYFSVNLWLMAAGACAQLHIWARSALDGVQHSLVFAPMLCVMMIAVRLRAMQLKVHDPQPWAQTAMYIAALSVLVQVVCRLVCAALSGSPEEAIPGRGGAIPGDGDSGGGGVSGGFDAGETKLASKAIIIALVALRYIASVTLYVAVAALIAALLYMEPDRKAA
jgi:hypothetical protein